MATPSPSGIVLDYLHFPAELDRLAAFNVHSFKNGHNGWFSKDGQKNPYDQVVEYAYQTPAGLTTQFRTWYMETSYMAQGQGMMASAKIDRLLDNTLDDHILLVCGFGPSGVLSVVQASLQFGGGAMQLITPIVRSAEGDEKELDNLLYAQLAATDYGDAGRNAIAKVVQANVICLRKSVSRP